MQARRKHLAVISAIWAVALVFASSAYAVDEMVGRYSGVAQGPIDNKPHFIVTVVNAANNKPMRFGIPNSPDADKAVPPKLAPDPTIVAAVKGFKQGDVIKITYAAGGNIPMLSLIAAYPVKPGEEEPNAFVFSQSYDHKEGKITSTWVELKKFSEQVIVIVPNHKDKTGESEPDPAIQAIVNTLKDGDVVLVEAAPSQPKPTIKHIEVYSPPKSGKLVKVDDKADLDGTPDTAVDIDVDGTTVTAFVPGKLDGKKFVVDSRMLAAVKKVHKDAEVNFRTSEENGHVFIRSIMMTKAGAHSPTSKPATMESDKPAK